MLKHYIKAARLRTLPLSVSGIIVGTALAYTQGFFNVLIFVLALLTTIGFQIISNFANDYGDGVKGTDNDQRVGPERAIQSGVITPKQMKRAIVITSVITFVLASILILESFGKDDFLNLLVFFVLGIASIAAAIKYTVGDKAYGYSGFGDVFVFMFFGILSVCGSYYLYTKHAELTVIFPAFTIGFLSVGVLNLNNMRDRESDIEANKNTLVVKIGSEFAKYYHYYLLISAFLFACMHTIMTYKSPAQFLFMVAFIPVFRHMMVVYKNENPKELDPELKRLALSTFLFAILFSVGVIL